MYGVKYSAVIGRQTRFFVCAQYELSGHGFFSQSHRRVSPHTSIHKTTVFRQTTVRATVVYSIRAPVYSSK